MELKVSFVFATGYGERAPIPAELGSARVVIEKPYESDIGTLGKLKLHASGDEWACLSRENPSVG